VQGGRDQHHAVAHGDGGRQQETAPRSGASSGASRPITPTGSRMASATPRIGTDFVATPSNLSAQAA
jgi:hypothetical protein